MDTQPNTLTIWSYSAYWKPTAEAGSGAKFGTVRAENVSAAEAAVAALVPENATIFIAASGWNKKPF